MYQVARSFEICKHKVCVGREQHLTFTRHPWTNVLVPLPRQFCSRWRFSSLTFVDIFYSGCARGLYFELVCLHSRAKIPDMLLKSSRAAFVTTTWLLAGILTVVYSALNARENSNFPSHFSSCRKFADLSKCQAKCPPNVKIQIPYMTRPVKGQSKTNNRKTELHHVTWA